MQNNPEQYANPSNSLHIAGPLANVVYLTPRPDQADRLHYYTGGCFASPQGSWSPEPLQGRTAVILSSGPAAEETAAILYGTAKAVRVANPVQDLDSVIEDNSPAEMGEFIFKLGRYAPVWTPDPLLSLFKRLEEFPEEEAEWLIPGWVPQGQISLIAADGGIGKTTFWCHIIAALSNGARCVLDPPGFTREPVRVMFLTTEDSVRKKLRRKLRLAGADMSKIITPDFLGDRSGLLHKLKFGSDELEKVLRHFRPALCIFDPVQGFTPPKVNMSSRNEMRDCMAPLVAVGEETGTTSLIVCHTNKRKGACGRDRVADSADLWDIARCVMMAGCTEEEGVRYLSNEKNNYAPLQDTVLFTISGGSQIQKVGVSRKRDRDYIQNAETARSAPVREDCKSFILRALEEAGGVMPTSGLEAAAQSAGFSFSSVKRVKRELKAEGAVSFFQTGSSRTKDNVWHIKLEEQPEDEPTPQDIP